MKKISIILLIGLTALTSCEKDVLDKEPLDIISDANVWDDPALIDAYLTQMYYDMSILTNEVPNNSGFGGGMWFNINMVTEVSDEAMGNWIKNSGYAYKFGLNSTGAISGIAPLLQWWEQSYRVIRSLNEFISRVPTAPVDSTFVKERVAEARFLRAYNYFSMVKRYGGVPLITEAQEIDAPRDSLFPERAKEQEVYDYVLSELDAIANDLPDKRSSMEYGRPSKYAALALKCRAALYAGSIAQFGDVQLNGIVGIDASKANDYYLQAYEAAEIIMNSGIHSLYNQFSDKTKNFRNIFLDKNNVEVIFARVHDENSGYDGGQGWGYDWINAPVPNSAGAGSQLAPYLEMVEEFEYIDGTSGKLDRSVIQQGLWTTEQLWGDKDPRFFASIFTHNTPWQGTLLDFHNGLILPDGSIITSGSYNGVLANGTQSANNLDFGTGFGVLKYLDESHTGGRDISSTDWIVFRYGEILLNYAEAAFELGKTDDALDAINQIRERAGIALLNSIDREKIRHERKVELAFEGHRYWDVRRWRIAVTALSKNNSGIRYILDYETGKLKLEVNENIDGTVSEPIFQSKNYYLPITPGRIGQNPNLVPNPGY